MKEQYPLSKQNESLIKKRLATYSSMAATFLALAPAIDVNAEIKSFDVAAEGEETTYIGHADDNYAINFNPLGVITTGGADPSAEVLIKIEDFGVASVDDVLQINQSVGTQFANVRILGSVSAFNVTSTTFGGSGTYAYALAAQLSAGMSIGTMSQSIVAGRTNGAMGFVNFQNGGFTYSTGATFSASDVLLFSDTTGGGAGNWGSPLAAPRFLGVQFQIAGETHYGWIELTVNSVTDDMSFAVTRFAYEDCPDTPIAAGETVNSQCSSNDIPTLSEWGLITLAILLLSFGTLYIGRREEELIGQGTRGSNVKLGAYWQKPPLVWAIFKKTLLATGGLAAVAGVLSYLVYGTIAAVDIAGTAIAGPLFAYLMHLLWIFEGGKKDEK